MTNRQEKQMESDLKSALFDVFSSSNGDIKAKIKNIDTSNEFDNPIPVKISSKYNESLMNMIAEIMETILRTENLIIDIENKIKASNDRAKEKE